MRLKSYTVATDTPVEILQTMDRVQFTLNSRIHPAKRKSVETVRKFREKFPKGELFVHYDFVYIASRYMFLNEGTKKAIIRELRDLMHPLVGLSGVVMHTDFPLRKDVMLQGQEESKTLKLVDEYYSKSMFNKEIITDSALHLTPEGILKFNLTGFIRDLFSAGEFGCPLYLENTTKTGGDEMLLDHLIDIVTSAQVNYPHIGLCVDTEHAFAAEGWTFNSEFPEQVKNLLVHLNPIPKEVKPCSLLDRHSETTLFECSQYTIDEYDQVIIHLSSKHVPYIRECYLETILREQQQLKEWENQ